MVVVVVIGGVVVCVVVFVVCGGCGGIVVVGKTPKNTLTQETDGAEESILLCLAAVCWVCVRHLLAPPTAILSDYRTQNLRNHFICRPIPTQHCN